MKSYARFGQIAVERGFVTKEQLNDSLREQRSYDPSIRLRPQRLIGEIFFEKGWINHKQIEIVLKQLSSRKNE